MRKIILFLCIAFISGCQSSKYANLENYLKNELQAQDFSIQTTTDTTILSIGYKNATNIGLEYIASIAALQFVDTAEKWKGNLISDYIQVDIKNSDDTKSYTYPSSSMPEAKRGLEYGTLFLRNFIAGHSQRNARYIDLDKISLEDLLNLNMVSEELNSTIKVESSSFDGFVTLDSEPHIIVYRARIQSKDKTIPITFQYDKVREKIFYFGINEE